MLLVKQQNPRLRILKYSSLDTYDNYTGQTRFLVRVCKLCLGSLDNLRSVLYLRDTSLVKE